jgi:hypothetical protein
VLFNWNEVVSPWIATLVKVRLELPVFVIVKVNVELFPTVTSPKSLLVGFIVRAE